jgi:hypothetical protein
VAAARVALIRSSSIVDELEQVHHRISERAYERYLTSDGCSSPDEDWLKAERELLWQPAVEVRRKDSSLGVRGQHEIRRKAAEVHRCAGEAFAGADHTDLDLRQARL